jgi:hypothetical protein
LNLKEMTYLSLGALGGVFGKTRTFSKSSTENSSWPSWFSKQTWWLALGYQTSNSSMLPIIKFLVSLNAC